ncbi:MAG: LPS export ABC transporter periplasmic protein LptC [Bacteroidia bacterium]|nr:LPS export ABC transporter periplasmic protein LptC [Bacteroidia bacterium]
MIFLMSVMIYSCQTKDEDVIKASRKEELPVETGKDVEIVYSDSFLLKAILKAPLMERYAGNDPRLVMPKGVHLRFFNKDKQVTSSLTANWAIRRENEKIMEAKDDVVVVNEKHETLNTEHLIWDERTKKIRTEAFAKITTADEIIFGEGLEANEDFSWYRILKVKGSISVKK